MKAPPRHIRWLFTLLAVLPAFAVAQGPPPPLGVSCSGSNAALVFGNYDGFNTFPTDMQATLVVRCTRDGGPRRLNIEVGLGPSTTSGSVQNRQLAGGAARLHYNIYRDAGRQAVWGDTPGVDTVQQPLDLQNKSSDSIVFTLFGRIFPQQDPPVGSYADSLLITIEY